jgi:hypothetical protein
VNLELATLFVLCASGRKPGHLLDSDANFVNSHECSSIFLTLKSQFTPKFERPTAIQTTVVNRAEAVSASVMARQHPDDAHSPSVRVGRRRA